MNSEDFRRETDRNIDSINDRLSKIEDKLDVRFDHINNKLDALPRHFITRLEAWAVGGVSGLAISIIGLIFIAKDHITK